MCIRTLGVGVNRDGAFAEFVVIPESNVSVHHEDVDPELGAIFDPSVTPCTTPSVSLWSVRMC